MSGYMESLMQAVDDLDRVRCQVDPPKQNVEINAQPENAERGLAQLVLTVVELLRQLMERQAIRRMEGGSLSDEQIDRMGETFMKLEKRMTELREHFDLSPEDLNLDLGPLGTLL